MKFRDIHRSVSPIVESIKSKKTNKMLQMLTRGAILLWRTRCGTIFLMVLMMLSFMMFPPYCRMCSLPYTIIMANCAVAMTPPTMHAAFPSVLSESQACPNRPLTRSPRVFPITSFIRFWIKFRYKNKCPLGRMRAEGTFFNKKLVFYLSYSADMAAIFFLNSSRTQSGWMTSISSPWERISCMKS